MEVDFTNESEKEVEKFVEKEYAKLSVEWFKKNFPNLYKKMENTEHGYKGTKENPYHMEGSVWTHTMMVIDEFLKDIPDTERSVLFWTCLLHDIGKCFVYEDNDKMERRRFFNHEAYSTFIAKPILEKAGFEKRERELILKLIALHTEFHKLTRDSLGEFVKKYGTKTSFLSWVFSKYDSKGRISKEGYEFKTEEFCAQGFLMEGTINTSGEKDKEIVLMIGPPGSGKSTYTKEHYSDYFLVSRDELVEKYGRGNNYKEKWNSLDHTEHAKIDKELNSTFRKAVKDGQNIVIDMTNMSRKSRRKWLKGVNLNGYFKKGIVFIEDPKILKERRSTGEKEVDETVIDAMIKMFVFPGYDEFDFIKVIC